MALLVHEGWSTRDFMMEGFASTTSDVLTSSHYPTLGYRQASNNPVWHCWYCKHLNNAGELECPTCGGPRQ